jgi:hypothetical protein
MGAKSALFARRGEPDHLVFQRSVCRLCGDDFTITLDEARSYARRGHQLPTHCRQCRRVRRKTRWLRFLLSRSGGGR